MIEYILEIELESGRKKYYNDIITIDFYDKYIRIKDSDCFIIDITTRKIRTMKIIPSELRKDNNE